jgi:hypothetical protein
MLFDPNYITFMEKILLENGHNHDVNLLIPTLKLGITYFVKIASHIHDIKTENMKRLVSFLSQNILDSADVSYWLLSESMAHQWVSCMFWSCPDPVSKAGFFNLLFTAIKNATEKPTATDKQISSVNDITISPNEMEIDIDVPIQPKSVAESFFEYLLGHPDFLVSRMYSGFWRIIYHYVQDEYYLRMIVESGFLRRVLNFFCNCNSSVVNLKTMSRHQIQDKLEADNVIFAIIQRVVCSSQIVPLGPVTEVGEIPSFVLPREILDDLLQVEINKKSPPNFFLSSFLVIEEMVHPLFSQMLSHLCANQKDHSEYIFRALFRGVTEFYVGEELEKVLNVFTILADISDPLQEYRCSFCVDVLIGLMEHKAEETGSTDECNILANYLVNAITKHPLIQDHFLRMFDKWVHWLTDASENIGRQKYKELAVLFCQSNLNKEKASIVWNVLMDFLLGLQNRQAGICFDGGTVFPLLTELILNLTKKQIKKFIADLVGIFSYLNHADHGEVVPNYQLRNLMFFFELIGHIFFYIWEGEKVSAYQELRNEIDTMNAILDFMKVYPIQIKLKIESKGKPRNLQIQNQLLNVVYEILELAYEMREDIIETFTGNDFGFLCRFILLDPRCMFRNDIKTKRLPNFHFLKEFLQLVMKQPSFITYCCRDLMLVVDLEPQVGNSTISDRYDEYKKDFFKFWKAIIEKASFEDTILFIGNKGLALIQKSANVSTIVEMMEIVHSNLTKDNLPIPPEFENFLQTQFQEMAAFIIKSGILNEKFKDEQVTNLSNTVESICQILPSLAEPLIMMLCDLFNSAKRVTILKLMDKLFQQMVKVSYDPRALISIFETLCAQLPSLGAISLRLLAQIMDIDIDLVSTLSREKLNQLHLLVEKVQDLRENKNYIAISQKLRILLERKEAESDSEKTQELIMAEQVPTAFDPTNVTPANTG